MVSVENLAICGENYKVGKAGLLFSTSFLKVKSKYSKYCDRKQTNCEPCSVWTKSTDFKGAWADMHRIFLNYIYVFYYQLTNRSNRVLLKNVTDKHMVMVELLLIRLQLYNLKN